MKKKTSQDPRTKNLPTGWAEEAEAMSVAELKKTIIDAEKAIAEVERDKADNEALVQAKAVVKEINEPYRDAVKAQRAKIGYALGLLDEKGDAR